MNISTHDHIAIQRLMYRYASCADHKDYAAFSEVFCEDAVFDYAGTLVTPCSAIQEMMHALDKYFKTQHQVHNVLYEVDGDTATGETYCLATHLIADSEDTKKIDMGITYLDRLRRTSEGWRIAHREFKLLWSQTSLVERDGV